MFMRFILPERRLVRKTGLSPAAAVWYDARHDTRRARREGRIAEHGLSLLVDTGAGAALARNAAALGIAALPDCRIETPYAGDIIRVPQCSRSELRYTPDLW